ncbi:GNAT family N-acetyltransferase [Conexibacter sp. DBS9H8]|uniref:GNAT family N-acetyltransferase n=1 Tax=Conexibacter sp. DBS9H8 TaxID=2937801 RepID=UPI00200E25D8|nr:GNAT family N-acetyltransferase [Conexibacter sp. DBS9H8]
MIELRPLLPDDLPSVAGWLSRPHVARWWLADTTAEAELNQLAARVAAPAASATETLLILECGDPELEAPPIGWCQWYPYDAYPAEAAALGAHAGDCGIDYAIGEPAAIGRGLGRELIAALVEVVRHHHPGCGLIVDPAAANVASRRVLEHNGFALIGVRSVATEPSEHPVAIYRLSDEEAQPEGAHIPVATS